MTRERERRKVKDYLWNKVRQQLDLAGRLSWLVPEQARRKREHIQLARQLRALRRAA